MMEKILYIHGLSSSGASLTAKNLRQFLPAYEVLSPDLPVDPYKALTMLQELCRQEQPKLILGTSMGGMFAQQLRGYKKILINPAFHVSEFMRTQMGVHDFLNPRQNGEVSYTITSALCDAYQMVESRQFAGISDFDRENTYALFGTKDMLVQGYGEYTSYYKNAAWFEGEHRLTVCDVESVVVPLIKQLIEP